MEAARQKQHDLEMEQFDAEEESQRLALEEQRLALEAQQKKVDLQKRRLAARQAREAARLRHLEEMGGASDELEDEAGLSLGAKRPLAEDSIASALLRASAFCEGLPNVLAITFLC